MKLINKIFGSKNAREIKATWPTVHEINALEEQFQSLSDEDLRAKTDAFKQRVQTGLDDEGLSAQLAELWERGRAAIDDKEKARVRGAIRDIYNAVLDPILPEAFAVVKNACRRLCGSSHIVCEHELTWNMIPYDVQLIGGIALHRGKIAEMATGEGKTLVATLPLYLNALTGKNVHLVTVNDYLARRDAEWMGQLYNFLGLSVGCIQNQMGHQERREQYARDITYGTNSEFGFDYLRDQGMAFHPESRVQRGYYYAIIDEVDSILIDEARTPLIISGPVPVSTHQFFELKPRVERLVKKQRELCNSIMQDARKLLEEDEIEAAQLKLYQAYHGMPKHRQLMHMLEDPAVRKIHEQIENMMLTDMRKDQARALREELLFTIDERGHDASLTDKGCEALDPSDPESYMLPDLVTALSDLDADEEMSEEDKTARRQELQEVFGKRSEMIHNVDQLIRAYCLYEKDVQYVIQNNQVIIVDEFTGRLMPGRRWSDGLHQAVEAKEGVKIERETQTLATITIQNYFRMYEKLAGMTGTAETEAGEFHDIYGLDVFVLPTNRPVRRVDNNDVIYKTQREKYKALIDELRDCHERGQPVLVGTISVDTSQVISRMLKRAHIPHNVLNAKNHQREADIVTRAGQPGMVTIATNMAGRGTDIKLGQGVVHLDRSIIESATSLDDRVDGKTLRDILTERPCGLHVIGSERHEARRIDRQLRGRCARQGDPGSSRFYISLEDDLMRLFGSDRIAGIMSRLGLEEGQQLEHSWLNRSIETAQRRVEQQNYSIRKRTLEYDDVMNKQREVVYDFRGDIVGADTLRDRVLDIIHDVVLNRAEQWLTHGDKEGKEEFLHWVCTSFPIALSAEEVAAMPDPEKGGEEVFARVQRAYELKVSVEDPEAVNDMERQILLNAIDERWQEYLRSMDALRQGVGYRAYGQRDPLIEYKKEAYEMFADLMDSIKEDIATSVFRASTSAHSFDSFMQALPQTMVHDSVTVLGGGGPVAAGAGGQAPSPIPGLDMPGMPGMDPVSAAEPMRRDEPKVGRNDPCPCGSGKKYKKCCGAS